MATPAQIEANRKNAQKSTGPRTEEGRARSSKNAITHGLTVATPAMQGENHAQFEAVLADLRNEHQPVGPTEDILVYKMAFSFFSSCRASVLLTLNLDRNMREDITAQVAVMLRYYNTSDRAFTKHLADLRKLQDARRKEEAHAQPQPQPEATPADEIGFVSQPPPKVHVATHSVAAEPPTTAPHPSESATGCLNSPPIGEAA